MSRSNTAYGDENSGRSVLSAFLMRQVMGLSGFALFILIALIVASLATWNISDPSFSYATAKPPTNILGYPGAVVADLMLQFLGLASVIALLPLLAWSLALVSGRRITRIPARLAAFFVGALLAGAVLGCVPPPATWPIPNGIGGVLGDMILRLPALFLGSYPTGTAAVIMGAVLAVPAVWTMLFAAGLIGLDVPEPKQPAMPAAPKPDARRQEPKFEDDEDDEREGFAALTLGAVTHAWFTSRARLRRLFGLKGSSRGRDYDEPYDFNEDEFGGLNDPIRARTSAGGDASLDIVPEPARVRPRPIISGRGHTAGDDPRLDDDDVLPPRPAGILPDDDLDVTPAGRPAARVSAPAARPRPGAKAARDAQGSFLGTDGFQLPAVQLLAEPRAISRDATLSKEALEENARMLEGVLEDFGVKGEIIHVRPGPVVTLYELEPAPGIKSSRVIGLADDIARSMSAIAARVAVVPGRNAIGIELPNQTRETVYLRELIASGDFEGNKAKLAMALGKTIGGEPVIADLAKMPHLLVAGTTGSGKSVAINTMILSLVYRLPPEKCRLIMIDPKMLELSIYDGIPHLLSPVVTDPKKAVVALKWTVREMEERYKKMSKIGVRNIDGFNSRVEQAIAKGEVLTRTVQTGFDRETGEAMYETEEFDLQPMPYIVVIIDEMADLMMVAGKDIEGAVQRLAQMARAAGIHVIMATQRPSVDVITGTIKANFPTRISFQVTSKIDSRTILGEQGAEQLLGMGDMLYMAGGGRIQRVHGPFVSDTEVEEIVAYLKTQGQPQYLDAITVDDDEDGDGDGPSGTGNLSDSEDPYDQAVAVVLRDGKASTSYIQRRLGIGYNRAASIIERMEQEGIVSPANHAGKREILVPTESDIID
ncbi:DNA translocase FtsK [Rhizobium halophytocola]|uniref:DNA translocase FtsK n=1 Tax=Rhizobium halophytocola TaxID=735519 RepID=A0ABS4E1Y7_9HYPH|nr:DNA translocase FtsK [Rhizobium halophytocola]MBP1851931.1 S-DNA-T family DNA segregation ATPase FtsK/SpoIIIE [Rhizobium halophytocola]